MGVTVDYGPSLTRRGLDLRGGINNRAHVELHLLVECCANHIISNISMIWLRVGTSQRERVRHVVATREELPPGERKIVKLGKREIGVFNIRGELKAIANICPHHQAPLARGPVAGEMKAKGVGDYSYERDGEIVRCPWHSFEFDLNTGRCLPVPDLYRVAVYPAAWEDDQVVVYV
jgi:3-phenylpropionate/trans-cinnamate dioxygenase ferredoxin subunit